MKFPPFLLLARWPTVSLNSRFSSSVGENRDFAAYEVLVEELGRGGRAFSTTFVVLRRPLVAYVCVDLTSQGALRGTLALISCRAVRLRRIGFLGTGDSPFSGLVSSTIPVIGRRLIEVHPSEKMTSVGCTILDVLSICTNAVPSFFWFLLRLISAVAASNKFIPGQSTPFNLLFSGVSRIAGSTSAGQSASDPFSS